MNSLLYSGQIVGVRFNLTGSDTVEKDSYVTINSHELFRNNQPCDGGVYDAHFGTTDHAYACRTCYNNKKACIGHEGDIRLNYPVWSPMGFADAKKWLKLICFTCGEAVVDVSNIMCRRDKRLDEASRIARASTKVCPNCKAAHPTIKKEPSEPLMLTANVFEDKKQVDKWIVYPHIAYEILSRISDATVEKLGKSVSSHPRNMVLHRIRAPCVAIRPEVRKLGGGRSTNDDLTTLLQVIVKKNDTMPAVLPAEIDPKLRQSIYELNTFYYEFIKASGDGAANSFGNRLKGKAGRFRKNQLGKRTRNMCRSTITGDPLMPVGSVGVPLVFARTIQYEEVVQEYNKQRLLTYVQNGRNRYPGATKIIKKNLTEYDVATLRDHDIECGDIILRDMIDGDPVNFNRQPSLKDSNIAAHRAVVTTDPTLKTLRMNVLATPLYNADFVGV